MSRAASIILLAAAGGLAWFTLRSRQGAAAAPTLPAFGFDPSLEPFGGPGPPDAPIFPEFPPAGKDTAAGALPPAPAEPVFGFDASLDPFGGPGPLQLVEGKPMLRWFSPGEFVRGGVDWWPMMNSDLLTRMDDFRSRLGVPVAISPAAGALGRHLGTTDASQHNVDRWGEVRAADVMPIPSLFHRVTLSDAVAAARAAGFTGIGAYPDWRPRPGVHLDVRSDQSAGAPATWGGINIGGTQTYVSLADALSREVTA